MPKFKNFILLLLVALGFWHFYGDALKTAGIPGVFTEMGEDINTIRNNPKVNELFDSIQTGFQKFIGYLQDEERSEQPTVEKPTLETPRDQTFSVHNIEIGDSRSKVEKTVDMPERSTMNEYGVEWNTYHENYHNFFMVAYNNKDEVAGLYTNQDLLSSTIGISLGTPRDKVLANDWESLDYIKKGWVSYEINAKGEYDIFLIDNNYVTIFYDQQERNTVTAILIIQDQLEQKKEQIYGEPSAELKQGFEYQLFDLTNATRVNHELSVLKWNEQVRKTAEKHSTDMAKNQYFSHTNKQGESPFDRMTADDISFRAAGENIAMGQFSSIFAHEGLMNSPGHRKNILLPDYQELGVGVDFNEELQPFYTENFLMP